jgi:asparagine synthase (glutamine-hydrolysing)
MCGIAGTLNIAGVPSSISILKGMTDAIAHRGPDGEGHVVNGALGLGHRRLAIIDLTPAGHQPMVTRDGRYTLIYNGEMYNFKELRAKLESLGHMFNSRTDSEVVLYAFAEFGREALHYFNGMFALALWDNQERTLLLARDRYGIKPLYYTFIKNTLIFASEIKGILVHPLYKTDIDTEGLVEYLTFQNFFTSRTLFKNIQILPAGCHLTLQERKTANIQIFRYWDYKFVEPENPKLEADYIDELDFLFQQAVNRQLVSDVDIGVYLSGGIDSGSIAAVTSKQLNHLRSFTCGFDLSSASGMELGFDERSAAEYLSYKLQTEHYEMVLKAGDMERILPRLIWHLEEPRVGQSYPNFYVAQLASKFVKVVLSGAGGDEIFGGYPWRYYRAVVNQNPQDYVQKYFDFWQRVIPLPLLSKVLMPIWDEAKHVDVRDIFCSMLPTYAAEFSKPVDYINYSLHFEAKTFLHGLLVVEDKLSMAHSLESRVPFLDNDLVDFAMKIPANLKLGNLKEVIKCDENEPGGKRERYYNKTHDGKLILRKMMSAHVPEGISDKQKQGFSAPDASWFRGESIDYVRRKLLDVNSRITNVLDKHTVHSLINEHLEGKENRRLLIWSMLSLENWFEKFM